MNYGAQICKVVLDGELSDVDAIRDQLGISVSLFEGTLGKLVREGALKRDRDEITVANKSRATAYARQAETAPAAAVQQRTVPVPVVQAKVSTEAAPSPKARKQAPDFSGITIEVRKGVPIPPRRFGAAKPTTFPFEKLIEIGDSFEIAVPAGCTSREIAALITHHAHNWARNRQLTFRITTRISEDDKAVGAWRIAPKQKK